MFLLRYFRMSTVILRCACFMHTHPLLFWLLRWSASIFFILAQDNTKRTTPAMVLLLSIAYMISNTKIVVTGMGTGNDGLYHLIEAIILTCGYLLFSRNKKKRLHKRCWFYYLHFELIPSTLKAEHGFKKTCRYKIKTKTGSCSYAIWYAYDAHRLAVDQQATDKYSFVATRDGDFALRQKQLHQGQLYKFWTMAGNE